MLHWADVRESAGLVPPGTCRGASFLSVWLPEVLHFLAAGLSSTIKGRRAGRLSQVTAR